jgi:hypothetical protein
VKTWDGSFFGKCFSIFLLDHSYASLIGFTRIKIDRDNEIFYIGYALGVKIGSELQCNQRIFIEESMKL